MAEVDRLMIEEYGIVLIQMMENAGRNLAELARRMLDGKLAGRKIAALCGAGNNGGGGMVAARHLHNRGAEIQVKLIADPDKLKNIPAHQWRILQTMGIAVEYTLELARADLIIDALIGYGLTGNPRGEAAEWIERANGSGCPILALGATATLTLALSKTGLIAPQAQPFVGELYLADIGVPPELYRRIGLEVGTLFAEETIIRIN